MAGSVRHWVWTLTVAGSNLGEQDLIDLINNSEFKNRYTIFQRELSEQGYEHYQGYTEFTTKVRASHLKRWIHNTIHVERRQGSRDQAREYCRKEETRYPGDEPVEIGTWISGSGHRSDLQSMKESMDRGATMEEVWDNHFPVMLKYWKAANEYKRVRAGTRDWKTYVSLFIGVTGAGKSHMAREEAGENAYVKPVGTKWFDFYLGQENAIMDEFHPKWMELEVLNDVMDKWGSHLECKGSHYSNVMKKLWITTNVDPRTWYPSADPDQKDAMYRRIDRYVVFFSRDHRVEIKGDDWEERRDEFLRVYAEYKSNK